MRLFPFPAFSRAADHFIASVLVTLVLPLLPLVIEWFWSGRVATPGLMLATAMYSLALGTTSRSLALFALTLIVGVAFSMAYGLYFSSQQPTAAVAATSAASVTLVVLFLLSASERYNRHVIDQEPFWEY